MLTWNTTKIFTESHWWLVLYCNYNSYNSHDSIKLAARDMPLCQFAQLKYWKENKHNNLTSYNYYITLSKSNSSSDERANWRRIILAWYHQKVTESCNCLLATVQDFISIQRCWNWKITRCMMMRDLVWRLPQFRDVIVDYLNSENSRYYLIRGRKYTLLPTLSLESVSMCGSFVGIYICLSFSSIWINKNVMSHPRNIWHWLRSPLQSR